jgi:hypothetical protein
VLGNGGDFRGVPGEGRRVVNRDGGVVGEECRGTGHDLNLVSKYDKTIGWSINATNHALQ